MSREEQEFADLLARVRLGEERAAEELVRRYEPELRRAIRLRLTDPRLRRIVDSLDVCQSVLARFFVQATAGTLDLPLPSDLSALLMVMVRNKVADYARRQQAQKRGMSPQSVGADSRIDRLPAGGPAPDEQVEARELLDEVQRRLDPSERYLAEQRAAGRGWDELARELSVKPDALRKKLARALDRVASELGLEDLPHE